MPNRSPPVIRRASLFQYPHFQHGISGIIIVFEDIAAVIGAVDVCAVFDDAVLIVDAEETVVGDDAVDELAACENRIRSVNIEEHAVLEYQVAECAVFDDEMLKVFAFDRHTAEHHSSYGREVVFIPCVFLEGMLVDSIVAMYVVDVIWIFLRLFLSIAVEKLSILSLVGASHNEQFALGSFFSAVVSADAVFIFGITCLKHKVEGAVLALTVGERRIVNDAVIEAAVDEAASLKAALFQFDMFKVHILEFCVADPYIAEAVILNSAVYDLYAAEFDSVDFKNILFHKATSVQKGGWVYYIIPY